jgi:hypothetical protein
MNGQSSKISSKIKKIGDISYVNIDDFENNSEILEFIKDTFGYKESIDVKLCLKYLEGGQCPITLKNAKNIVLTINDKTGHVSLKDTDNDSIYHLNNDHSRLIGYK